MLDFVVKYWIEWLFGLLGIILVFWFKRWYKLERDSFTKFYEEKEQKLKIEITKDIEEKMTPALEELEETNKKQSADIEALYCNQENLTVGILSIQGKQYRDQCRTLLDPLHEITIDEYEQEEEDYTAYKGLGGNHKGDTLHAAVVAKYKAQIQERVRNNNLS